MQSTRSFSVRKFLGVALGLGLLIALTAELRAERASPHETVTATIGGSKVTIEYGRPAKKGREIFGKLVPFKEVWRAGADEATTLTTEGELTIGKVKVAKGSYSLFVLPNEKEWTLIINKEPKQWGAYKYAEKQDLGRTPLKLTSAATVTEQFTIAIAAQGNKGALTLSWDKTVASVEISAP